MTDPKRPGKAPIGAMLMPWSHDAQIYMDWSDARIARLERKLAEAKATAAQREEEFMRQLCGYLWVELAPSREMDADLCNRAIAAVRERRKGQ